MYRRLKNIFWGLLILSAVFNLTQAYTQAIGQLQDRQTIPLHSLGFQFMGLENVFTGIRGVGYYTDKNLEEPLAIAQLELAQYMLAPTVLDLNHTQYHWVIFDCTTPQTAMEAIQRLKLIPVKTNHNIILALNPYGI